MDSDNDVHLSAWKALPDQDISPHSDDPVLADLLAALSEASFITIDYYGGSSPGSSRSIRPERIFIKDGSVYVEAYCTTAGETRTFKVDRIRIGDKGYEADNNWISFGDFSPEVKPAGKGCLVLFMLGFLLASFVFQLIETMLC